MKTTLQFSLLFLLLISTSSCLQRMYFPERANTPGLTEAYEAKATLSFKPQVSSSGDSSKKNAGNPFSFAADIAFAPADHFGIFGSYRSINHRLISEPGDNHNVYGGDFTGHRWEGAVGYFDRFGRVGKYEIYGGYGQGIIRRNSSYSPQRDYNARYGRIFLQPAVGVGNQKFSFTGGFRLAYQKFYDYNSRDSAQRYHMLLYADPRDVEKETMGFIEPFANFEVGGKYVKGNVQVGCSAQIFGGNVAGNLPAYVSLGVVLHFAPSFSGPDASKRKKD